MTVIDIGFGMGYNLLALLMAVNNKDPQRKINIYSFEKDDYYRNLLREISFGDERDTKYALIRRAFEQKEVHEGGVYISVLFGDARKRLHDLREVCADAVFQDPFSPGRNPELWTVEFFTSLFHHMKEDAVMTTYSGALHVRGALLAAGLKIGRGPGMGKKREGTLAGKGSVPHPLSEDELNSILSNVKSTPYRDLSGSDSRELILQCRLDEMALRRSREGHQAHR